MFATKDIEETLATVSNPKPNPNPNPNPSANSLGSTRAVEDDIRCISKILTLTLTLTLTLIHVE
eukprot:1321435-Amorphochlora_amoeboformis.AAC.1